MRSGVGRGLALAIAALLCGCWATSLSSGGMAMPGQPTLGELGVAERCAPADPSCWEAAQELVEPILVNLGEAIDDPATDGPDAVPPGDRLIITFDSDPPFRWRSAVGGDGETTRAHIDLTDAVDGGMAYAVVVEGRAFVVDAELARRLLDVLFVPG